MGQLLGRRAEKMLLSWEYTCAIQCMLMLLSNKPTTKTMAVSRVVVQKTEGPDNQWCTTHTQTQGVCTTEASCPAVTAGHYYPSFCQLKTSRSRQGHVGVCCLLNRTDSEEMPQLPPEDRSISPLEECVTKIRPLVNTTQHFQNYDHLEGIVTPRHAEIVGGHTVLEQEFPWVAAIGQKMSEHDEKYFCGGTLITNRHVLTAAHCITTNENMLVLLGTKNLTNSLSTRRGIKLVHIHPDWTKQSLQHDMAIIELDEKIQPTWNLEPICLSASDVQVENRSGVVSGWGRVLFNGSSSNQLLAAEVEILTRSKCVESYAVLNGTTGLLCARRDFLKQGANGIVSDSCQGDSGGGLVVVEEDRGYLVGIVAGGLGCGKPEYPGIYVDVRRYISWITDTIL